jgi:hypothetical protein
MALLVFAAVHAFGPLLVLVWQWHSPVASRAQWTVRTAGFAAYLTALLLAGFWTVLPRAIACAYLVLLGAASVASWRRIRGLPWPARDTRSRLDAVVHAGLGVVFLAATVYAMAGHRMPEGRSVELSFPLRDGTFAAASAGGNRLVNFHLRTLEDPRLAAWRGQSHAVDIVKLDDIGMRARGFAPGDLNAYAVFGQPVLAPCAGRIVALQDGLPDQSPPGRDIEALPGNFVVLECDDFQVLLAHLKQGSASVRLEELVSPGQALGQVGNSGNSTEPHLHIHAQLPGSEPGALDGAPLPITFGGRYLARNDRVVN